MRIEAACAPYHPVTVRYGPFVIHEETGGAGTVAVGLPFLPNTVAHIDGIGGAGDSVVAPPEGGAASGFLWIDGRDVQLGLLLMAGMPVDGRVLPELAIYPAGQTPVALNVPVTVSQCGRTLTFDLMRDGWSAPRAVSVALPDCAFAGSVVRVPIATD